MSQSICIELAPNSPACGQQSKAPSSTVLASPRDSTRPARLATGDGPLGVRTMASMSVYAALAVRYRADPSADFRRTSAERVARLGSARSGSARLGSAQLGSTRLGASRLGQSLRRTEHRTKQLIRLVVAIRFSLAGVYCRKWLLSP